MLRTLLYSFVDLMLPICCPVCGGVSVRQDGDSGLYLPLCRGCREDIFAGPDLPVMFSGHLHEIFSLRAYHGAVKNCIKQLKYRQRPHLIHVFKSLIKDLFIKNRLPEITADLIIPVPIHRKQRRRRGFNQAELVAEMLSGVISVPVYRRGLVKTKNTLPQAGLSRKARICNLKDSFSVSGRSQIAGKSIILADDVMTTGATLEACARPLLSAGAKSVKGFTLARTPRRV